MTEKSLNGTMCRHDIIGPKTIKKAPAFHSQVPGLSFFSAVNTRVSQSGTNDVFCYCKMTISDAVA